MKGLFKSKPRTPAELVRQTRDLLAYVDANPNPRDGKRDEKVSRLRFFDGVMDEYDSICLFLVLEGMDLAFSSCYA